MRSPGGSAGRLSPALCFRKPRGKDKGGFPRHKPWGIARTLRRALRLAVGSAAPNGERRGPRLEGGGAGTRAGILESRPRPPQHQWEGVTWSRCPLRVTTGRHSHDGGRGGVLAARLRHLPGDN
ncbi:unnamed protein product [Lasius platythorax]|uniref:Uncharacterized protein n=1 Tax=Lasius platythorax TaxID=488582 RepID=A0AAV2NC32_9HYME